jgi:hypothetical protein
MKSLITFAYVVCITTLFISCGSKEKSSTSNDWKALDSYHDVLAAAYHPLKDSGNVEPARRLLTSLAEKGDSLALASLPEKVNNEEMKSLISKIASDTRSLADEVKVGASDSIIAIKLNPIHDQFHKIHELWTDGKEHKEHHKE